ncbi:mediator of RNA polymerase II transcription subunit 13 [Babesia caballi]|uniref:Mediator of RNA polymerase II transcription subunit 13 n=1 Tax=Babesia caballi TaxID=5871 RepID=A0AAV4LX89_BABCB|nr:mediator of RNA polymerase II transcription subunit 13 [Babesia caballi]
MFYRCSGSLTKGRAAVVSRKSWQHRLYLGDRQWLTTVVERNREITTHTALQNSYGHANSDTRTLTFTVLSLAPEGATRKRSGRQQATSDRGVRAPCGFCRVALQRDAKRTQRGPQHLRTPVKGSQGLYVNVSLQVVEKRRDLGPKSLEHVGGGGTVTLVVLSEQPLDDVGHETVGLEHVRRFDALGETTQHDDGALDEVVETAPQDLDVSNVVGDEIVNLAAPVGAVNSGGMKAGNASDEVHNLKNVLRKRTTGLVDDLVGNGDVDRHLERLTGEEAELHHLHEEQPL